MDSGYHSTATTDESRGGRSQRSGGHRRRGDGDRGRGDHNWRRDQDGRASEPRARESGEGSDALFFIDCRGTR